MRSMRIRKLSRGLKGPREEHLYVYRESGFDVIECVDFDKDGRVAISNDRILFDKYDKKHYGEEPTMGGE